MLTIGTAGHIDHGKSSLIKALTSMDPDRLPEEKERGMTIDWDSHGWRFLLAKPSVSWMFRATSNSYTMSSPAFLA
jgi:translation elongation factor EF-1alpha